MKFFLVNIILKELLIHENPQFSTEDFFKSIQKRQNQIQVFFVLDFHGKFHILPPQ